MLDMLSSVCLWLVEETNTTLLVCTVILATCCVMLYRNLSIQHHDRLKSLQPQLSIEGIKRAEQLVVSEVVGAVEGIKRAEQRVVSDLVDAVEEVKEFVIPKKSQRFRKRDRVWFYGRRLIRRVEDNVKYVENVGVKGKREAQKRISNITRRMLGDVSDQSSTGDPTESRPAEDWFDEDNESPRLWVPHELRYLLNSFHMFGQFDPAAFAEVYSSIETMRVSAGQYLFRIGEPDMFIFVVQSGRLDVTSTDKQGSELIKQVRPGESLTSLLSFIDILTGHARPYKTVQAQAQVDSIVLRLSMESFLPVFDKNPELLIRVVQMVMARVQRVVFTGLHQYLGLSKELMISEEEGRQGEAERDPEMESLELELALAGDSVSQNSRVVEEGVKGLQRELDLEDDTFLRTVVEVRSLQKGDTIMSQQSHSDVALGYIVHGELVMSQGENMDVLYHARAGACFGQLAMLTGEASFYTCKAKSATLVVLLSKASFFSIVSSTPEMVLSLAHSTIRTLSPLVRKIDFALDWLTLESGRKVPDVQGSTFVVLSGRLRGYTVTKEGEKQLAGEYGRGSMVGLLDVITGVKQKTAYLSVRDSELCVIPAKLLEFLKTRSMVVMAKLISILGNRLVSGQSLTGGGEEQGSKTPEVKYNSVAVIGNDEDVPVLAFCHELEQALMVSGPVSRLSSQVAKTKLGPTALDVTHDYRLNAWLGQQEDRNICVIYQCDKSASTVWSKKCLRHADLVLVVVRGDGGKEVTKAEHDLEIRGRRIRKDLVILWPQDTKHPVGTREWLKKRPWLSSHFHVKMPIRMTKHKTVSRVNKMYASLLSFPPDIHSDFSRIARGLQGKSIGLVLGGGGARGAAHLGMLKAIDEAGIPIDKVGGVSIGAYMGALWALHREVEAIHEKAHRWFEWMCNPLNAILDLTYPITSIFTGQYFNSSIVDTFSDSLNIEDLWLPYYCVSTDINTSSERVHTRGTLWRYVRASMSYAWILPPICDPVDGHMLLDGCYVNNVPGDVMLRSACSHIIVVDVTLKDDSELTPYGDSLSGWWLLWKKWIPFISPIKIPTQADIQERLSYCSHYKNLEELKNNTRYEYIQPPVGHFSSSKFDLFEEIFHAGYHHGSTFFYGLRKADQNAEAGTAIENWLPTTQRARKRNRVEERRNSGNYTFTDLAQMVVSGVKAGREWQNKTKLGENLTDGKEEGGEGVWIEAEEVVPVSLSNRDQDSDDTGIVL